MTGEKGKMYLQLECDMNSSNIIVIFNMNIFRKKGLSIIAVKTHMQKIKFGARGETSPLPHWRKERMGMGTTLKIWWKEVKLPYEAFYFHCEDYIIYQEKEERVISYLPSLVKWVQNLNDLSSWSHPPVTTSLSLWQPAFWRGSAPL